MAGTGLSQIHSLMSTARLPYKKKRLLGTKKLVLKKKKKLAQNLQKDDLNPCKTAARAQVHNSTQLTSSLAPLGPIIKRALACIGLSLPCTVNFSGGTIHFDRAQAALCPNISERTKKENPHC